MEVGVERVSGRVHVQKRQFPIRKYFFNPGQNGAPEKRPPKRARVLPVRSKSIRPQQPCRLLPSSKATHPRSPRPSPKTSWRPSHTHRRRPGRRPSQRRSHPTHSFLHHLLQSPAARCLPPWTQLLPVERRVASTPRRRRTAARTPSRTSRSS